MNKALQSTRLLIPLCWLFLVASPASAETTHKLLFSFDGGDTPAGSFNPDGLYVDNSAGPNAGDVYVDDGANTVVDRFSSSGEYEGQITGAGTPSGSLQGFSLGTADGTVDPLGGNVYVPSGQAIDEFSASGSYVAQVPEVGLTAFSAATGTLFIAAGDSFAEYRRVDEYDPSTHTLTEFASGCGAAGAFGGNVGIRGIAVDNNPASPSYGDVYVADTGKGEIDVFDSSGSCLRTFSGPAGEEFMPATFELGAAKRLVERLTIDSTTGELYAEVQDRPAGFASSNTYSIYQFSPTGTFLGHLQLPWVAHGIAMDGTNGHLYVGDWGSEPHEVHVYGPDVIIPTVRTVGASTVGPTTATLEGVVNPDGVPVTNCHFDYGTTTTYGHTANCIPNAAAIGGDSSDHTVTVGIVDLTPGTTYHFRLEANNANGSNFGKDVTFLTTPPPAITEAKVMNLAETAADLTAKVNPRGNDTSYRIEWGATTAYGNTTPVPDGDVGSGTSPVAVKRHIEGLTSGTTYHWRVVATNLAGTTTGPDHTFIYDTTPQPLPDGRAYEMVTPPAKNGSQFDAGLVLPAPEVSEEGNRVMLATIQCFAGASSCTALRAPEGSLWSLDRTAEGWRASEASPPSVLFSSSSVRERAYDPNTGAALFSASGAPEGRDQLVARRPDGSFDVIGPVEAPGSGAKGVAVYGRYAASRDMSRVVFGGSSPEELGWPFDGTVSSGAFTDTLYEYEGTENGEPFLVGVTGGRGSTTLVSQCGTELQTLSHDGRRVVFAVTGHDHESCAPDLTAPPVSEVLVRTDASETTLVSERSALGCTTLDCESSTPEAASFVSASSDATRILFNSEQQLTNAATQGSDNLYLYDFSQPAGDELTDVSAGDTSGDGPDFKGIFAFSGDGSHAYFVAGGVLTSDPNSLGKSPIAGDNNLYLYERDAANPAGRLVFIASLPNSDQDQWHEDFAGPNVTPDGRFLAFASHGRLTSDDSSESGAAQVFRYDAATAELLRLSIGKRGFNDNGNAGSSSLCAGQGAECNADATLAPVFGGGNAHRRDPTMSHDGSYVFFQSPAALAPGAMDYVGARNSGQAFYGQNVYEYHEGHVYLISDGKDADARGIGGPLIGTDADGSDVFFKTFDPLVPADADGGQLDLYDARIGGGFPPEPVGVPCRDADACSGPGTQALRQQSPGTSTFQGSGNETPVRHRRHRRMRRHHHHRKRHYGKKHHGKKHHRGRDMRDREGAGR